MKRLLAYLFIVIGLENLIVTNSHSDEFNLENSVWKVEYNFNGKNRIYDIEIKPNGKCIYNYDYSIPCVWKNESFLGKKGNNFLKYDINNFSSTYVEIINEKNFKGVFYGTGQPISGNLIKGNILVAKAEPSTPQ